MEQASPVVSTHHLEGPSVEVTLEMRRAVAAAMRNPSILEPNIHPVLDILIEANALSVEADGEAEVDVASLPAHIIAELHALLVAPQTMPPASKGGSGTTPIRRRAVAASTHVDAGAAAPPQGAVPAKDPPQPRRSFESLLRDALECILQEPEVFHAAMEEVVNIAINAGALKADDDGPVLDLDILDIPAMLKLYGALIRAKRAIARFNAV